MVVRPCDINPLNLFRVTEIKEKQHSFLPLTSIILHTFLNRIKFLVYVYIYIMTIAKAMTDSANKTTHKGLVVGLPKHHTFFLT